MDSLHQSFKLQIKWRDLIFLLLFYFFFSFLYNTVLWYNGGGYSEDPYSFLDLRDYWIRAGMQYALFLVASVFIWFLGSYLLRNKKIAIQIGVIFLLIPIVIYGVREFRYFIVDSMGLYRLQGTGSIWDWYIPLLFFYIQFGCFFAYRYFKENQQKLKLEGELRRAALTSELSAIKAQLNPHFLYNVFNTINASVPSENEKTRQLIAQLSDIFRYQLRASKEDLVTLKEELDFIEKYLELEKERFGNRLTVEIQTDEELYQEKIPPMLLQPLVENSIKHGLSSLIDGGSILISIHKKEEKLHFEIADTGVGTTNIESLFNKGIGITNTQLRLRKNFNSQLEILHNQPKGLKVRFSL